MDEGALGVEQIELVVEPGPRRGDGGGVGKHAKGARDFCEVASGDDGGGLVADAQLEAGGAPIDELDRALGLDGADGLVDVLGDDVSAVEQAAGHYARRVQL